MYKLFAGEMYYPAGGYGDFRGSFDTLEEAIAATSVWADWAHVVFNDEIVWERW